MPVAAGATLQQALEGGEDYELMFTAHRATKVPERIAGVKVSRIGTIARREQGLRMVAEGDVVSELQARGWEHFGEDAG